MPQRLMYLSLSILGILNTNIDVMGVLLLYATSSVVPSMGLPRRLTGATFLGVYPSNLGSGDDGSAGAAKHRARRSSAVGGDNEMSGDGGGVGKARSLSTSSSGGNSIGASGRIDILAMGPLQDNQHAPPRSPPLDPPPNQRYIRLGRSRIVWNVDLWAAPLRHKWDLVFQLVFEEFFSPPACVASPVPVEEAPALIDSIGLPSSTTVDQDAPSPST
ncbi:hypothetical protein Tco_0446209 [Tanacetum coccineum]